MKKVVLAFLAVVICSSTTAQEPRARSSSRRGEAAGYATRDATVLSMMGWGLGLIVGMATLFALLDNNSTSGGGGGGSNGHNNTH